MLQSRGVYHFILSNIDSYHSLQESYSPAVSYLMSDHGSLSPFLSTVLLLLYEVGQVSPLLSLVRSAGDSAIHPVLQGSSSDYSSYIETLPQQHDCIICWSKGQLSELQGTADSSIIQNVSAYHDHGWKCLCSSV